MTKFCKDCKYYLISRTGLDYCLHSSAAKSVNLVTGVVFYEYASAMRNHKTCGEHALHFEPKPLKWYQRIFSNENM